MKRFLCLLLLILLAAPALAEAAGSCALTSVESITIDTRTQRKFITLTCTGDGTITAYSLNPITHGIRGWYLYNVTTNPGSSAPTAAYDITLLVDSEDVAGGKLADRSASATQTVLIADSTIGYFMMDGTMAITFANETANPSTIVMVLRFTSN